jgi:hypothetical protein
LTDKTAIFVQAGSTPAKKQTDACLLYAISNHLPMVAIIPPWVPGDAVAMCRSGEISTVITAFDSRAARQLAADIDGFGQVIYVHPEPGVIVPPARRSTVPDMDALILRWHRAGRTPHQIAAELESDTTDVRAILRRAGEYPSDRAE